MPFKKTPQYPCFTAVKTFLQNNNQSDQIYHVPFFCFVFFRIEIEDSEAVGISNIISNLITMFPRSTLMALPSELFTSFINCLTLLTCSFGRSAALEEVVSINTFTWPSDIFT